MRCAVPAVVLLSCGFLLADHPPGTRKPAVLLSGLGNLHHPVSTKNPEAQKFFDQGLSLIYAFNHDEAHRSFQRAAELDPQLAMAWWGMALAVGPNYNLDAEAEQLKKAYESVQTAIKLSATAPEHERAYIQALAQRYSADPKTDKKELARAYKGAMAELARRYPDDLDAATLYGESMMNLRPWELWSPDGKPADDTEEIIAILESVLRRNPDHIGANHYYVHAVEASPTPERGLAAAHRLKTLAPGAGHLVHMPSHIYIRVGDYAEAARANEKAAQADREYILKHNVTGVYPMMYYSHNLHFLAVAHALQGRFKDAKKAADDLAAHVGPHVKDMPMLEGFMPTPILIQVRFRRWDDILQTPAPDENQKIARSLWHFARGLAVVAKSDARNASDELKALRAVVQAIPEDMKYGDRNTARKVLSIPEALLEGRIQQAYKREEDAIACLRKAIVVEDSLNYIEPADWHLPVRESLGGLLLRMGKAAEAEKVFREDLERNRRNGRSLFGLMESLKAQKKGYAAQMVQQQFRAAWKNADVKLAVQDL
jgi:tetratricopeptide (TPR) repeat protein